MGRGEATESAEEVGFGLDAFGRGIVAASIADVTQGGCDVGNQMFVVVREAAGQRFGGGECEFFVRVFDGVDGAFEQVVGAGSPGGLDGSQ